MTEGYIEFGLFVPRRDLQWIVEKGVFSRVTVTKFQGQGYSARANEGQTVYAHRNLKLRYFSRERWTVTGSIDDGKAVDLRKDILERFQAKLPVKMDFYVERIECEKDGTHYAFRKVRIPPVADSLIRREAVKVGSTRPSFVLDLENRSSTNPGWPQWDKNELIKIASNFPYGLVRQCRRWTRSETKLDGICEVIYTPAGRILAAK